MNAAAGERVQPFPWEMVMHAGLCRLRLAPSVFWALTPREFFCVAGGFVGRGAGFSRSRLEGLMAAFPDG
ncbi:putative phage protein (TIGR02216 family) [Neorhizobium huautlense]|uniref:Phage protein (TIGR02216 family) n=1 Tax=Neorhizobium huautlense TaxID=67774 RepID=A0ABT9PUN1_9HYPH|nr:rcc01693 family protein [Neorhizobium huautlense]MDP9838182.1 putative phage protein (TIGR02216 family) [Neorhizobium huautlense]